MSDNNLINVEDDEEFNYLSDLQNFSARKQKAIMLFLSGVCTSAKVAQMIGLKSPNTVYKWLGEPEVKAYIQKYQEAENKIVDSNMKAMRTKAMETVYKLMDSDTDQVALAAAKDILDRTGHKPKQEITKNVTVTTFEKKLGNLIDDTIDCEYEVVDED